MPLRTFWFVVGLGSILLGAMGIFLPLLPTTPFLLLAAFAFARSSDRWHTWLHHHRLFGPIIDDWHQFRAIDRRAKIASVVSMVGIFVLSLALQVTPIVLAVQAVVLTITAAFLLSRPSPPGR